MVFLALAAELGADVDSVIGRAPHLAAASEAPPPLMTRRAARMVQKATAAGDGWAIAFRAPFRQRAFDHRFALPM